MRGVLVRDPHAECEPHAWLGTDLTVDPSPILAWCVRRGRLEVTWQEARAQLGMATPRQGNARAIARTTPALLGLFSMIPLGAGPVAHAHARPIRQAGWSRKIQPTFADALAVVRQPWWTSTHVYRSPATSDLVEIPSARLNRLTETLGYAA
jgi:hypothetical protein